LSELSLLSIIFTTIISIVLPIGLIVYFVRKYSASLVYFTVGIMVFIIAQIFIRIPLIEWLSDQFWFSGHIGSNKIATILFLSLTAGVFEEVGRFVAFRFVLLTDREWKNGIAFGIGHGGIEAVTMVGINYLGFIVIALNTNYQWFNNFVAAIPHVGTMTNLLIDSSSSIFLLAGIERLFVIIIHIGLSLFVLNGVRVGRISHLFYAIGFHTILNFSIILASVHIWVVEAIVGTAALICIFYIKKIKCIKMYKIGD